MHGYYSTGELKAEGSSITEGIGQARITRNLEGLKVDQSWQIPDAETVQTVFDLVAEEGLVLGSSSGINVAGAVRMARALGPGHVIVTVLCDSGSRYASRLFNPDFLRSKSLPVPPWLEGERPALPDGALVPVP
jgi:cysteine synthase A